MKRSKKHTFQRTKKKRGKALAIVFSVVLSLIIASIVIWVGMNDWDVQKSYQRISSKLGFITEEAAPKTEPIEETPSPIIEDEETPTTEELVQYVEGQVLPEEPTYVKDVLIANKQYPLPSTFAPGESTEAREAFEKLAAEAALSGFNLTAFSTYRSFEYQTGLYDRYVERDGAEEADRYSARPGYSEHQTGLAFDIGEVNREQDWASERFGHTEAGKWLAANAHHYGFIMRYPEGKEAVTGYMHESWHFRYVGLEIAEEVYENELTLEEYLGI